MAIHFPPHATKKRSPPEKNKKTKNNPFPARPRGFHGTPRSPGFTASAASASGRKRSCRPAWTGSFRQVAAPLRRSVCLKQQPGVHVVIFVGVQLQAHRWVFGGFFSLVSTFGGGLPPVGLWVWEGCGEDAEEEINGPKQMFFQKSW